MSETKYGFINGVAIEAGEGKELVAWTDAFPEEVEAFEHHYGWYKWTVDRGCCLTPKECFEKHLKCKAIAFRRPKPVTPRPPETTAKVGASAPDLSPMVEIGSKKQGIRVAVIGHTGGLPSLSEAMHQAAFNMELKRLEGKITTLRTALDAADKCLKVYAKHFAYCSINHGGLCNCGYTEALTLIAQTQEAAK